MMENEDGDIFEVADPRGEFEQKVISEMQIAAFAEQSMIPYLQDVFLNRCRLQFYQLRSLCICRLIPEFPQPIVVTFFRYPALLTEFSVAQSACVTLPDQR